MSIEKKSFGFMPDGKEVFCYILDNGKNVKAEIITYGGIIKNLWVKNNKGKYTDVVLGRDTLEEYLDNEGYFGAIIGRCANRIAGGKFSIGGREYVVNKNEGNNTLHGGIRGFDKYVWDADVIDDKNNPKIKLSIISPDGDEGFPGELGVTVTYTLNENDGLEIKYEAQASKDTVANLTNHSYFNLNGAGCGNIENLYFQLDSDFYTPNTDECIPYGEVLSVKDTPLDFNAPAKLGERILSDFPQIKKFGGLDLNFIIKGRGFRKFSKLHSEKTGICMTSYTDKPAVQIYTGNCIEKERVCKGGKMYNIHDAICIETQYYPNSTAFPHFTDITLKAGDKYEFKTEYRFSIK